MPVQVYFHSSEKMPELADESVQFCMTSTNAFEPLFNALPEIYRVLKQDGTFLLNIGQFPNRSGAHNRLIEIGYGDTIALGPYIVVESLTENKHAPFKLLEDIVCLKDFGVKPRRWIYNYDHFFLFAKSGDYKMMPIGKNLSPMAGFCLDSEIADIAHFAPAAVQSFLECLTEKGDVVLDPLAGTGPFAKIAHIMGRNPVIYEIDKSLEPLIMGPFKEQKIAA